MENNRLSTVVVDTEKNRLYITLVGSVCKEEVERIFTATTVCVPELKPGFSVVTDLTQCKFGHLSGIPTFHKIMEFLLQSKVGKVVRVVGKAKIIFNQVSRITESFQGYKAMYVSTLQEAEEKLSESQQAK
jgi:hypothetical protein